MLVGLTVPLAAPAAAVDGVTEVCSFTDDRFTEISGMTYSQRHDNVIYLHNDSSGGPRIYAVDALTCETLATLTIDGHRGARHRGDRLGSRRARAVRCCGSATSATTASSWPEVRLHRVREPKVLRDRTVAARTYRFTYPERPLNAEALLADPASSRVWVVTKQLATGTMYALPKRMSRSEVNVATPVGTTGALVTDGSVSPDGTRFALRDYVDAEVFDGLPPGADAADGLPAAPAAGRGDDVDAGRRGAAGRQRARRPAPAGRTSPQRVGRGRASGPERHPVAER